MLLTLTGTEFWRVEDAETAKAVRNQSKTTTTHKEGVVGHVLRSASPPPAADKKEKKKKKAVPAAVNSAEELPVASVEVPAPTNKGKDKVGDAGAGPSNANNALLGALPSGIASIDANPVLQIAHVVSATMFPIFASLRSDIAKLKSQVNSMSRDVEAIHNDFVAIGDLDTVRSDIKNLIDEAVKTLSKRALENPEEEGSKSKKRKKSVVSGGESEESLGADEEEEE